MKKIIRKPFKLKLNQYFCLHTWEKIATHKHSSQELWQCKKCLAYHIFHTGIMVGYNCQIPNIGGWNLMINTSR